MINICRTSDIQTLEICSILPKVNDYPYEYSSFGNLSAKRRREMLTGRQAAARGLNALGCRDGHVGTHPDRSPIWPQGFCGSISHSNTLCAVTIGRQTQILSLGIDIEQQDTIAPEMAALICQASDDTVNLDPVAIFSAKEAYYKLWYPLAGEFLDFPDVSIRKGKGSEIIATLRDKTPPTPGLSCVTGYIAHVENHVMTFFALANKYAAASLDPLAIAHDLV